MELNTLESFFNHEYMPHGHCYLWQSHILWTNVISDFLIALAYFSLPFAIMLYSIKRKDIGYQNIFLLFSLFILFCGITHVIGIFTIWHGVYGIHGVSKALTAIVSVLTAIYVYKLLPAAVNLPTMSQYENVKDKLDAEVEHRSLLEGELQNQKLVNFVLNGIPISTLMLNKNLAIVFSNHTFLKEFGVSENQSFIDKKLDSLINLSNDNTQRLYDLINSASIDSQPLTFSATSTLTGDPLEVCFKISEFEDQLAIVVTLKNLAEVNKIKSELSASHQNLERAFSATEDGIWEWDVESNNVKYSPQLLKIIGKPDIESPTFDDWFSHIHDDYKDKVKQEINNNFTTRKKYAIEYLGLDKDRNYSWFIATGDTVFNENGEPEIMSGSLRNIETTKQLERENQENQDFIQAIYQGSSQAIWLLNADINGDFTFEQYNEAACAWTRIRPEQIIGKTLSELSGSVFPPEVTLSLRENYSKCVKLQVKLDYVEKLSLEGYTAWYKTTLYPIKNIQGNVEKIVGTSIDITQEQVLLEKLKESNEYLERFAFVASHDLQEPLRKIIAFSELLNKSLQEHISEDEDAKYQLSRLINSASRMRTMIDDILKLSRINSAALSIKNCSLESIIDEVTDILSNTISEKKAVVEVLTNDVTFQADPALVSLLFQNLISNAIKFSRIDKQPTIQISIDKQDSNIIINCTDNGIGIGKEYLEQIFEPFRRLHSKSAFSGSGIGLALCQQIIKVHGGNIKCQSVEGKGSSFIMTLPK